MKIRREMPGAIDAPKATRGDARESGLRVQREPPKWIFRRRHRGGVTPEVDAVLMV
jgi:hypothetical protein